ncbi:hypothetical protein QS306_04050 [Paraburkholderia bonniea]|uniref:type IV pilus modification PilV family protein n=1 Tax=Paraburkholderia bonniea TaxID=2152891 RepID=UPI00257284BB|nr:hypothetical protein [Paraburkholderia bonniea]WJF90845.1 hypothetical protein QS306_04050 [Paraburkholderia bonniea]WJF94159.1 hypothetical protein QS308_04050 [Paraburkholderia bonniea]
MSRRRVAQCAGIALVEVMLAIVLMAVNAMGLIATQLWTVRETRAMLLREQAWFFADALAEAAHGVEAGTRVQQWQGRAVDALPQARVRVTYSGGAGTAQVSWASVRGVSARVPTLQTPSAPQESDCAERSGDLGDLGNLSDSGDVGNACASLGFAA